LTPDDRRDADFLSLLLGFGDAPEVNETPLTK
jgi:hypothetical protein